MQLQAVPSLKVIVPSSRQKLRVLGLDPGETTGMCLMVGTRLEREEQLKTKTVEDGIDILQKVLDELSPDVIAYEDYRVYAWEVEKHKWAALHTPKLIGSIIAISRMSGIECVGRMAYAAKNFVTDDKLKAWGLYTKGKRHARDATRHAVYQLVFGSKTD